MEKPTAQRGIRASGGAEGPGNPPLFSTLLASKPQRERRRLWIGIALAHVAVITVLWFTDPVKKLRSQMFEIVTPIMLSDEPIVVPLVQPETPPPPQPVARPVPPPVRAAQPRTPAPRRSGTQQPIQDPLTDAPLIAPREIPSGIGSGRATKPSLLDRLNPGAAADPRLFAPVDGTPPLVGPEASRARISTRIGAINDSIMAERYAAERATDWTVKGKDGKRWGVSPGKIHLGDIVIPLGQSSFVPPNGRRDEINAALRTFNEIEAQARRDGVKDSFDERVREIRKRKEKERTSKPITN